MTAIHPTAIVEPGADLDAKLDAGAALLPVALILWTDQANVSRPEQIIYFNQALDYYPSSGDFVFHPAA